MKRDNYYTIRSKLTKKQILTIPNILSFFRLTLIPLIVWLYVFLRSAEWTSVIILLSGLTDIADGFIARKFNMVSDFGKAIDPLADKLTQIAILFCLVTKFPLISLPLILMFFKEIGSFILRLVIFKKTERVEGASWHGKANTVLLYSIILLHIVWTDISSEISSACIIACTVMMVISFTLYSISGVRLLTINSKNSETNRASDIHND